MLQGIRPKFFLNIEEKDPGYLEFIQTMFHCKFIMY